MTAKKPTALVILDGFGYRKERQYNAIAQASKPTFDYLEQHYPHTLLKASGIAVGLLPGYMGNSEVGHLTIGSGRIIPQAIKRIHDAIDDGSFFKNPILLEKLHQLARTNHTLHIMGLLSDAGVHSHIKHLFAFIEAARDAGIHTIVIHAFLDGRDVPPKSAEKYLTELQNFLHHGEIIGSISGRFYAMDRDKNWERTEAAYRTLTEPQTDTHIDWQTVLTDNYKQGITDEFIKPTQLEPNATIKDGDGIIFFNFRADRARQLTAAFVDDTFKAFKTHKIKPLFFITPTQYSPALQTDVLYSMQAVSNTLKDVLSEHGYTIFTIAETEKYAHVTYFFTGGREREIPGEKRVLIPSLIEKNYIHYPCMSAPEITEAIVLSLENQPKDFYLVNYANADMVGHSGNMDATVKAIECLDAQLKVLYNEIVEKFDGTLFITADHGNAEQMFDPQFNQPRTAHTSNPVPFLMINKRLKDKDIQLPLKELSDIAPFILRQLNIPIPQEMM